MSETLTLSGCEPLGAQPGDQRRVERFQTQGTLGTGGMGVVEHAYDLQLHRHVALKLPRADRENAIACGADLWREGQLTAQLEHPRVPPVYELLCNDDGVHRGFVMKLIRGKTLLELIDELGDERLAATRLAELVTHMIAVCDTVAFAHRRLILHLDLKPENVMIESHGGVYLIDWGVAARCGRRADGRLMPLEINRGARGTINYMAPEQFESGLGRVDDRTDVHGLGGILFHILHGRAPFRARCAAAIGAGQHTPPEPSGAPRTRLEALLTRIACRALSTNMDSRFHSVSSMLGVLRLALGSREHPQEVPCRPNDGIVHAVEGQSAGHRSYEEPTVTRADENVRKILSTVWLFADVESRDLDRLCALAVRRRLDPDAVIVRQGERDGDLYVVLEGLVRVTVQPHGQRELALNLLRKNDVFGELSLVDGRERSATITAVLPTQLLVVRRDNFMDILSRSPGLGIKLLGTMAGHVRRLTERVEDLSVLPVSTRLAKKLLEIADLCGASVDVNSVALPVTLSQQDLADHIQATRESVNKCIAKWMREDIVYRTPTQIVIQDRLRLRAIVAGFGEVAASR